MYLKSIEIQGFKSFANKMVFEFHDGITAIVGPNGSGKSNVADAVRWVLGEQSAKQLRGSKMEDVIFAGTEARKPQGFAYVAITLDNSDHKLATAYEEVTVARRVYRSGESEYLMNGVNCRLRDVQELFLDTGIGREGYSIIGQGQIDKVLSGKPEERRELFDEAAGITKFKKRKAAAEKNLEAERQNLCRINDILAEITTQVGPLEKQSIVAKEYLNLRDQLKNVDVNMFLMEYDRIHDELKSIEEKQKIAESNLEETKEQFENTREEYDRLELELEEKNQVLESKKNELNDTRLKKEQMEGDIKVLNEQIAAAKQNSDHYRERVQVVTESLQEKERELEHFNQRKMELDEGIGSMEAKQKAAKEQLEASLSEMEQISKSIEQHNSSIYQSLNDNTELKTDIQKYQTMLEQATIKKAELTQRVLENKTSEAGYEEAIEQGKSQLEDISKKIQGIQSNNEEFLNDSRELKNRLEQLQNEDHSLQQTYLREKSKLDSLKNITERYEGYGQSIRRVMEQKEKNPGIVGVVADIIKVEKSYETAMEIALGGSIQNIVTKDEEVAKKMIGYLKQNKFGRATFLPLTTISTRGGFNNPEALKEKGAIGLASTLVKADKEFEGLVEYLLGRILVVDNIDNAIAIARKYHQSIRMVTIDGEQINPGGAMSGGAFKNSSNLLSRRREMEDIEKELEAIEKQRKTLKRDIDTQNSEREKLLTEIEKNKEAIQKLYLQQNTAKIKYEQAVAAKEENQLAMERIHMDNSQIEVQIRELKDKIDNLNSSLKVNTSKSKNSEEQIEQLTVKLEEMKQLEKQQREQMEEAKLNFSSSEQNIQFVQENIRRITEEIAHYKEELVSLQKGMEDSEVQTGEKEENIKKVRQSIEGFMEAIKEKEEQIQKIVGEKESIEKSHKGFFARREELSSHMNNLDKEVFRLGSQKEKLSEQSEGQMNYMWEEYELTYSSARLLRTETEESLNQLRKRSGELKQKIKGLGDVNVNAIEDYKNLSERYELLRSQHDDLIEAEGKLVQIIAELEEEMRKQFAEKFEDIKVQFDKVFKELFGGGKGTIELQEDEDILEAGIRIIAQPPGKKLQNMMQLSGGEKALTAISLLFAIQNLKPSPFCLLDEIEAALDDSNVTRYAKYLHKLTKDTQFIVITHRRGTMAAADILYGITMQEKGVSTLVSVSLLEDDLDE